MSSTAQITANQKDAQLSTGPRTDPGKAVSAQNGLTQGFESRPYLSGHEPGLEKRPWSGLSSAFRVLVHENQSEFDALKLALETEFQPKGEHESFLVGQMVQTRWRLNRINRLETVVFDLILLGEDLTNSTDADAKIINAMSKGDRDPLTLLVRYRTTAERAYYKAHREFTENRHAIKKDQAAAVEQIIRASMYGPTPGELERLCQSPLADGFASQDTKDALRTLTGGRDALR